MEVDYIDHMGSDLSVVNAARVSFDKSTKGEWDDLTEQYWPSEGDKKLIAYLAKHNHWSPFAHAFVSLRIKAPIFVARQLVKHQVGLSWNEVSRRYVDDEPEFWFPEVWRGRADNVKQGSGDALEPQLRYHVWFQDNCAHSLHYYTLMLEDGVAPEMARMVLPQNTMTEWIWSGSLMAFTRVCKQRLDPHAQQETQEVAKMIADIVEPLFPVSWKELINNA